MEGHGTLKLEAIYVNTLHNFFKDIPSYIRGFFIEFTFQDLPSYKCGFLKELFFKDLPRH